MRRHLKEQMQFSDERDNDIIEDDVQSELETEDAD